MSSSIYRMYLKQMKVDAALGDKLLKETENFFEISSMVMRRVNPSYKCKPIHKEYDIRKRASSIY